MIERYCTKTVSDAGGFHFRACGRPCRTDEQREVGLCGRHLAGKKRSEAAATYTRSADREYQRYMQARGDLARLAGRLAGDGYLRAAFAIRDGLEVMPLDLPGLWKQRERVPPVSHGSGEESGDES